MRRYLIVAVAGLLLVAGCTSGSDDENVGAYVTGGGGTASSTTLDPAEAAKAPGVTDTSVKIGVTYVDESAVKASGIDLRLGEYQKSYEVLVDQINKDGGINGRKLDLVFAPINPVGTAPAEEVCLELTEDDEVFAAVGFFLNDAVLCPVELHETAVIGGNQTADRLARAKAPWFTTTPGSEMPKQVVRAFDEHGDLDGKVAVFAAVGDQGLLEDEVLPLLDELGVDVVEKGVLDVPQGDQTATDAGTKVIAEKFEASGADTVLLVGQSSVAWPTAMQNGGYKPKLLFSDASSTQAFLANAATTDTSVMKGAVVGGPYGGDDRVYEEPKMQDCIGTLEDAGIEVPAPDPDDANEKGFTGPEEACVNVALLTAILEAAGKDLNYATFRQAGETLGEVDIPGDPSPRTYGPPPATDGSPKAYLSTFDASTNAFVPVDS